MSDGLKIQGEVSMSAGNTNDVLDGISNKAAKMAVNMAEAGAKAGKAIDEIGEAVKASDEKFTKAESNIVASAKRFAVEIAKGTKSASDALGQLDFNIAAKGLDPAKFAPVQEALRKLGAEYKTLAAAQNQFANASGATAEKLRSTFGSNLQNTSYQLQDFIVQVNGGVDATKALGQQLPQMLVGFGAAGAAIGVLAALLPNLVQALSASADGAKTFKDSMSDFDKAVGDVGSTVKSFDMEKLYDEFNKSSDVVRAATIEQVKFQQEFIKTQQLVANKKFGESIADLGSFGTLDKLAGAYSSGGADKLSKQLGITLEAAKDMLPILNGVKAGTEDVNLAFERFGRVLLTGNPRAIELAGTLSQLAKANRDAAAGMTASSEAEARMSKGHVQTKKELDDLNKLREKSAKSAEQEAAALENLLNKIYGKDQGFSAEYVSEVNKLLVAYDNGTLSIEKYNDAFARLREMQPGAVAATKELQKAEESRAKYMQTVSDETEKLVEKAKAAEYENSLIGKSADEIARLTTKRYNNQIAILEEKKATIEKFDADSKEIEYIEKKIDALKRLRDEDIAKPKLQAQAREWENFSRDIERSLTDALYRSFESGESFGKSFAKSLENTFKTMVLKFATQAIFTTGSNILNAGINAIRGTSGSNGGAGENYFGLANNASSMYNIYGAATGYSSGVNSLATLVGAGSSVGASSASMLYANGVGAVGGDSLGALIAANGSWSGVSTGAAAGSTAASGTAAGGTAGASGAGLSVGTVAWVAAIIYGMYMSNQLWNQGVTWDKTYRNQYKNDDLYKLDTLAQMRDLIDMPARTLFGDSFVNSEWYSTLSGGSLSAAIHAQIMGALVGTTRMLGSGIKGNFTDTGFNDGQLGIDMKKTGSLFGSSKTWTDWQALPEQVDTILDGLYQSTKAVYLKIGETLDDTSIADKLKAFSYAYQTAAKTGESTTVDFAALITEAGASLADAMGQSLFPAVEGLRKTVTTNGQQITESWSQAFSRIVTESTAVNSVLDAMGKSLSDAFGANNANNVLAMSDAMVKLFGSIDGLTNAFNAYYENFYSDTEKTARSWELMQRQFDALGVAMPKTREGFRALVDGLDLNTAAGQQTFSSLMNLQAGFAALTPALEQAAIAVQKQVAADRKDFVAARYASQQAAEEARKQNLIDRFGEFIGSNGELSSYLSEFENQLQKVQGAISPASGALSNLAAQAQAVAQVFSNAAGDIFKAYQSTGKYASEMFDNVVKSMFVANQALGEMYAVGNDLLAKGKSTGNADLISKGYGYINAANAERSNPVYASSGILTYGINNYQSEATQAVVNNAPYISGLESVVAALGNGLNDVFSNVSKSNIDGLKEASFKAANLFMTGQIDKSEGMAIVKAATEITNGTFIDLAEQAKATADTFAKLSEAARSLSDELLLDKTLSVLNPAQMLLESQRQYEDAIQKAMAGDGSGLNSGVNGILKTSQSAYSDAADYDRSFARVQQDLRVIESLRPSAKTMTMGEVVDAINELRAELRASGAASTSAQNKLNRLLEGMTEDGTSMSVKVVA